MGIEIVCNLDCEDCGEMNQLMGCKDDGCDIILCTECYRRRKMIEGEKDE